MTDLPRRSDPAARGERDSHSAGWMSTACAWRRVFSSFGLSSPGRSAESDERHPACQNPPGGRGFSVPPLVLFSSRDISPPQHGRWLNQQLGHQLVLKALQVDPISGPASAAPIGSSSFESCRRFLYSALNRFFFLDGRGCNPFPLRTCGPPDGKQVGAEREKP